MQPMHMSTRVKAILTLAVSAPILTEIASGNTPAHALLSLRIDLFLLGVVAVRSRFLIGPADARLALGAYFAAASFTQLPESSHVRSIGS